MSTVLTTSLSGHLKNLEPIMIVRQTLTCFRNKVRFSRALLLIAIGEKVLLTDKLFVSAIKKGDIKIYFKFTDLWIKYVLLLVSGLEYNLVSVGLLIYGEIDFLLNDSGVNLKNSTRKTVFGLWTVDRSTMLYALPDLVLF